MTRLMNVTTITMAALLTAPTAGAGEAETSATAGTGRGRNGTAAATARYEGDIGFARTDTRSGRVNVARGVAVGFDEDGLSLSLSNAIAGPGGPAIATNFNLSIGLDGEVSHSIGTALAEGPFERSASAGGSTGVHGGSRGRPGHATATSVASGSSDPFGRVHATTRAHTSRGGEERAIGVTRVHRVIERRVIERRVVERPGMMFRSR